MSSCGDIARRVREADTDVGTWLVVSGHEVIAEFSDFMRAYHYRLSLLPSDESADILWRAGRSAVAR